MKVDTFTDHFAADILFSSGEDAVALWSEYRGLAERLTKEVEAGKLPKITPKEVGTLHRIRDEFLIDDAFTFKPALNRITIDKDYYGSAMIGMGDLIAIRSAESAVASRVEYLVIQKLSTTPLVRDAVSAIRSNGHSRGAPDDIKLAKLVIGPVLSAVAAVATLHDGSVTLSDIEKIASTDGVHVGGGE